MNKKLKLLSVAAGMLVALACQSTNGPDGGGPELAQQAEQAVGSVHAGPTPTTLLRVTAAR